MLLTSKHALQLVYSLDWRRVAEADARMDRVRYDQLLQARACMIGKRHRLCLDAGVRGCMDVSTYACVW